jgi:hypothetical protein
VPLRPSDYAQIRRQSWEVQLAWEERAAIMEYEGPMIRVDAETRAWEQIREEMEIEP